MTKLEMVVHLQELDEMPFAQIIHWLEMLLRGEAGGERWVWDMLDDYLGRTPGISYAQSIDITAGDILEHKRAREAQLVA